jgi:hypothetical protein
MVEIIGENLVQYDATSRMRIVQVMQYLREFLRAGTKKRRRIV